jgi:heme exporter protein D
MSMYFSTLADLIWMEGHGPFVWSSYIITFLAIGLLALLPLWRRRRFVRQLRAARVRELAAGGHSVQVFKGQ